MLTATLVMSVAQAKTFLFCYSQFAWSSCQCQLIEEENVRSLWITSKEKLGSIFVLYESRLTAEFLQVWSRNRQYLHRSDTELTEDALSWAPTSKSESLEARPRTLPFVKYSRGFS